MRSESQRSGFTLIELLIVMTLVGILALIVWARFGGIYERAYRSSMISDLKTVASAQEIYYAVNMTYGTVADLGAYSPTRGVTVTINHADYGGFAAVATHAGAPTVSCAYYSGTVPPGTHAPATQPDVPMCN